MSRSFQRRVSSFFGIFRSAIAVSAAAEAGRPAGAGDLSRLGIDPAQFRAIERR